MNKDNAKTILRTQEVVTFDNKYRDYYRTKYWQKIIIEQNIKRIEQAKIYVL